MQLRDTNAAPAESISTRHGRRGRASAACKACHMRKIRCDMAPGSPCRPCLMSGNKCTNRSKGLCIKKLPDFVRPLPATIEPEDAKYLEYNGVLTLPDITLQDALLQVYIEFFYPYMPLIDLHNFIGIVAQENGSNGQVSLLLYHSIMFSAVSFVDLRLLCEAGFKSREAARGTYFRKVKLLYDNDYEQDILAVVQSIMHLTYWYETSSQQKDGWYWLGVAISQAKTIALHCEPQQTLAPLSMHSLRKRVWWMCFIRDFLMTLDLSRPGYIRDGDFTVSMLVESDFEIRSLPDEIKVVPECILIRNTEMQRQLAAVCISRAQTCFYISQALTWHSSTLSCEDILPAGIMSYDAMTPFMETEEDEVGRVNAVDRGIRHLLSPPAVYQSLEDKDVGKGYLPVTVQRIIFCMEYQAILSLLPELIYPQLSWYHTIEAAAEITTMAADVVKHGLEKYLPPIAVTAVCFAMKAHWQRMETKGFATEHRRSIIADFERCNRVMERLRESYSSADLVILYAGFALNEAVKDRNSPDLTIGI